MCFALNSIHQLSLLIFSSSPESPYYVFNAVLIFCPTVGYFDQLKKIIYYQSYSMFNVHTAVIQILSNFLRFIYWQFEPFKIYLLGQSIAVFSLQIISSFVAFSFYDQNNSIANPSFLPYIRYYNQPVKAASSFQFLNIFQATTCFEFFLALIIYFFIIIFLFGLLCLCVGTKMASTVDIVLSNIIDTLTSLPHFVRIVINKDIDKVSYVLIGQFLTGDFLKMGLYIFGKSPWPFIFGASLQIILDTIMVISYVRQKHFSHTKKNHQTDMEFLINSSS